MQREQPDDWGSDGSCGRGNNIAEAEGSSEVRHQPRANSLSLQVVSGAERLPYLHDDTCL